MDTPITRTSHDLFQFNKNVREISCDSDRLTALLPDSLPLPLHDGPTGRPSDVNSDVKLSREAFLRPLSSLLQQRKLRMRRMPFSPSSNAQRQALKPADRWNARSSPFVVNTVLPGGGIGVVPWCLCTILHCIFRVTLRSPTVGIRFFFRSIDREPWRGGTSRPIPNQGGYA